MCLLIGKALVALAPVGVRDAGIDPALLEPLQPALAAVAASVVSRVSALS
jgi:hypothetical protein